MKNLIIVLCGMLFWTCSNNTKKPEIFIPEKYQKMYDMTQRMEIYQKLINSDPSWGDHTSMWPDTQKYIVLIDPNLRIRDVFTGEDITDIYDKSSPADKAKFALYTINYWRGARRLLIFNKGEFTVLYVGDYQRVLKEIVRYFDKHKDLDPRLLPLCVQKITEMYVSNRRTRDDHGPWRHWWDEEADSLGRIYNQHLRYLNY